MGPPESVCAAPVGLDSFDSGGPLQPSGGLAVPALRARARLTQPPTFPARPRPELAPAGVAARGSYFLDPAPSFYPLARRLVRRRRGARRAEQALREVVLLQAVDELLRGQPDAVGQ